MSNDRHWYYEGSGDWWAGDVTSDEGVVIESGATFGYCHTLNVRENGYLELRGGAQIIGAVSIIKGDLYLECDAVQRDGKNFIEYIESSYVIVDGGAVLHSFGSDGGGNYVYVNNGGTLSDFEASFRDTVELENNTHLSGETTIGPSATLKVHEGTTLQSQINVEAGGVVSGGTLTSFDGIEELIGSSHVYSRALSVDQTVMGDGVILVDSGALADNSIVQQAGRVFVYSGGLAQSATIEQGGYILLYAGGTVTDATISAGAALKNGDGSGGILTGTITNGGTISGGTLTGSGTVETVLSGGVISGQTVSSGATLRIHNVGQVSGSVLSSGGQIWLDAGGTVANATISAGAALKNGDGSGILSGTITNGGTISGGTLTGSGTVETVSSGGVVSGQTVSSGATLNNAGQVSGGTLLAGATEVVSSGATATGQANAGKRTVQSGGSLKNAVIAFGGTDLINSSGLSLGGSIEAGGSMSIASGGTAQDITVSSSGLLVASSGGILSGTITNSGTILGGTLTGSGTVETVLSGSVISGQTAASGATIALKAGATLSGTVTICADATVLLNGGIPSTGKIAFSSSGGRLIIDGTVMPQTQITGFNQYSHIDFANISRSSIVKIDTSALGITLTDTKGNTYFLPVLNADKVGYTLNDDGHGGSEYLTCFAQGTLIKTPEGEVPVEELHPGQMVSTPNGDRPIKWVGYRAMLLEGNNIPDDHWLVRVKAHALGNDLPARDLLITQEHCLVFEGCLVPVRMLVNGQSIVIDRSITSYTYYHVELDNHEPLYAEGILTESYLDTGNRTQFTNCNVGGSDTPYTASGNGPISLKIETSRAFVEPLYWSIAERANITSLPPLETTSDSGLHLECPDGKKIFPARVEGANHVFIVPPHVQRIVVKSKTFRPAEIEGPFVDDRRDLGVLIGKISLFGPQTNQNLVDHLHSDTYPGWDVREATPCRWTKGAALLLLPDTLGYDLHVLVIEILAGGPYIVSG